MKTQLHKITAASGATFKKSDGWELPLYYTDPYCEYDSALSGTVIRDISACCRLKFTGDDHLDFLHRVTTNAFNGTKPGTGLRAVFLDNRGRIVELGTFYRSEDSTLAVLSRTAQGDLAEHLDRYIFAEKIEMTDLTKETAMVEILGNKTAELLWRGLAIDLTTRAVHEQMPIEGATGAKIDVGKWKGLRLWGTVAEIETIWNKLTALGVKPFGEGSFSIHRIEAGMPEANHELGMEYNPWEAGLDDAIHMNKGCYIGQEVIARLDTYDKVKQHLCGLKLASGELPASGTKLHAAPKPAGTITSVTTSPRFGNIALGYARNAYLAEGTELQYDVGGCESVALVTTLPFG